MVFTNFVSQVGGTPEIGRFRQILPQIIACTVKNCLLLSIGLTLAMPTIIIPALIGQSEEINSNEPIRMTPNEASWLGSVSTIAVPLGSVLSGWVTEPFGRKRSFVFTSIPHLIAWLLLHYSTTYMHVFIAQVLIGIGIGLMEAPLVTYIGEIVESSLRGTLMAVSGIAATLGLFIVYVLGSITEWRNVALYCFFIPLVTMVAVCFIPESPLWLLSKNRTEDAQKSLQWLRGWVPSKAVEKELNELKRHIEFTKTCAACYKAEVKCVHPPATAMEKLRGLFLPSTLKPFTVLLIVFTLNQITGTYAMKPYLILIFKAYGTPLSPSVATAVLGLTGILGTTTCVCIIRFIGKRKLFLCALLLASIPKIAVGIYGFIYLPIGTTSFFPREGEAPPNNNYFPLIAYVVMQFINSVGVSAVPHMLLSELLPCKTRGIASGIVTALNSVVTFIVNKSYYNLELILTLPGTIMMYGVICIISATIAFYIIPETENRSLEDIEMHFSDKKRKFFDRKIQMNAAEMNAAEMNATISSNHTEPGKV